MYRVHIIPKAQWRCTNYEKYTFAKLVGKLSDKIYVEGSYCSAIQSTKVT